MGQSTDREKPAKRARRSRGDGSIIETADGRLRGRVLLPHPDGTRTVTRWVSGRTRAEVSRKLEDLRREAERGGFASGETLDAFLARWIDAVRPRLRESTWRSYRQHVDQHWRPLVGRVELVRLTPTHVERAMAQLTDRGLSPMTVAHSRSTLRRALHDAQRDGLVHRNVASLARPPRITRREMHALSAEDVARLLEATADDPMGPVYRVAVGTGLRLGELMGLRWSDVDIEGRTLVVRRAYSRTADGGYAIAEPKTARSRRTVMLPAVALDGLRRQKVRQAAQRLAAGSAWQDTAGQVFTDAVGRPARPDVVSTAFRQVSTRLKLGARFHDLRHTAASLLLAAGVPLKVVSETLGHSSIAITADVYAHVTPDLRREAADAMDRALGGAS